jgi:hypothetical protein
MPDYFKYIVLIALALIIYNLYKAFAGMFGKKSNPQVVLKSLTLRIGLSFALFILLFVAYGLGVIKPHGFQQHQNTEISK